MILTLFHLTLALLNIISTTRLGSILAVVVVLYCLTSFVGGYTSVRFFRQFGGKNWIRCIILQATLFPAPVLDVFMCVNCLAIAHGSTSALPFSTILTVALLSGLVCFPLTVFGGIMAKNYATSDFNAPTRTTKVARFPRIFPFTKVVPFNS